MEDTLDWYAQDMSGNLWYLGEDTKEYEGGKVSPTGGSWEAGVDGASSHRSCRRSHASACVYRQEYYKGFGRPSGDPRLSMSAVEVPVRQIQPRLLMTRDYTPLDPNVLEHKFSRGVGPVLVLGISGSSSREELVTFEAGAG